MVGVAAVITPGRWLQWHRSKVPIVDVYLNTYFLVMLSEYSLLHCSLLDSLRVRSLRAGVWEGGQNRACALEIPGMQREK